MNPRHHTPPLPPRIPPVTPPDAVVHPLPAGATLIRVDPTDLPLVSMRFVMPAGSVYEAAGHEGLAHLTGALLTEGTDRLDPDELNAELDRFGIALDVRTSRDACEVSVSCLASVFAPAVGLASEIIRKPRLPMDQLRRIQAEVLEELEARHDDVAIVADDRIIAGIFGTAHPYGRPVSGGIESVRELQRSDLVRFHAQWMTPADLSVVLCGPIEEAAALSALREAFGGWEAEASGATPPLQGAGEAGTARIPRPDSPQVELRLGALGPKRTDPEWISCTVANHILGGSSITSRLGRTLREERGWTYHAGSSLSAGRWAGAWIAECAVEAAVADPALEAMEEEIARMRETLPSAGEVEDAKRAIILSMPRAFETPGARTARYATLASYGLPLDSWRDLAARIERVTAEEVRAAVERYLAPDRIARVAVGG